jgi:hypothetical protein
MFQYKEHLTLGLAECLPQIGHAWGQCISGRIFANGFTYSQVMSFTVRHDSCFLCERTCYLLPVPQQALPGH